MKRIIKCEAAALVLHSNVLNKKSRRRRYKRVLSAIVTAFVSSNYSEGIRPPRRIN